MKIIRDIREYISERPTSLTIGKFDGFHAGHRELIRKTVLEARERSLFPVLLAFDAGKEELLTAAEREAEAEEMGIGLLIECPFTDELRNMSADRFVREIIAERLRSEALFIGEDFRFGYQRTGDAGSLSAYGRTHGFSVEVIPDVVIDGARVSSTRVRASLAEGELEAVGRMLGHPYYLSVRPDREITGRFEDGMRPVQAVLSVDGRTCALGAPDGSERFRFAPDPGKLLPPDGRYGAEVRRAGNDIFKVDVLRKI